LRTDHQFPGEVQFHFDLKVKLYVAFGNQKQKSIASPLRSFNPKGIKSSSPALARQRLRWVNVNMIFPTLKGLNHPPVYRIIPPCRNHSQKLFCTRCFQPKTDAHFFATNRSAKNCTAISAAF
jgi:hypothetical protein